MLKLSRVHPSSTSWAAPLHMLIRKNSNWRLCGENHAPRALTILDRYPVPHVHEFAQLLQGTAIYSKNDLVRADNQVPVGEKDIPAITAPFGLFKFLFISFGRFRCILARQCNCPSYLTHPTFPSVLLLSKVMEIYESFLSKTLSPAERYIALLTENFLLSTAPLSPRLCWMVDNLVSSPTMTHLPSYPSPI